MKKEEAVNKLREIVIKTEAVMEAIMEDEIKPDLPSRPFERGDLVMREGYKYDIIKIHDQGSKAVDLEMITGDGYVCRGIIPLCDLRLITRAADREIQVGDTFSNYHYPDREFVCRSIADRADGIFLLDADHRLQHYRHECTFRYRPHVAAPKFKKGQVIRDTGYDTFQVKIAGLTARNTQYICNADNYRDLLYDVDRVDRRAVLVLPQWHDLVRTPDGVGQVFEIGRDDDETLISLSCATV